MQCRGLNVNLRFNHLRVDTQHQLQTQWPSEHFTTKICTRKVRMCNGFQSERRGRRDPADEGERHSYVARQLLESDARVVPARRADFHAVQAGRPREVYAPGCGWEESFGDAVFKVLELQSSIVVIVVTNQLQSRKHAALEVLEGCKGVWAVFRGWRL